MFDVACLCVYYPPGSKCSLIWASLSEHNSLLLPAVNPITLLGQGGVSCANIFGRSEKNDSVC